MPKYSRLTRLILSPVPGRNFVHFFCTRAISYQFLTNDSLNRQHGRCDDNEINNKENGRGLIYISPGVCVARVLSLTLHKP